MTSWFDFDSSWDDWFGTDADARHVYHFTPPEQKGSIYISVESYYLDMIPASCYNDEDEAYPDLTIIISKNGVRQDIYVKKPEFQPYWFSIPDTRYEAGDLFEVTVQYFWNGQKVANDYTVIVYSQ